jgi:hypothetical protein
LFYIHRKTYPDLLPAPEDRLVVGEALHPYFGVTHRPGTPFEIPAALRDGTATPIILTTVNKQALDQLVGPTEAFEIVGTLHDLWKLQDLVEWRLASHAHAMRSSPPPRDS